MLTIDFNTLAYGAAFDFIPSQDPNVSLRVYLPVGNWLNDEGLLRKKFAHPDIVLGEAKGELRFKFWNGKDKREQHVKINGDGVIAINGMKPAQLTELYKFVISTTKGPDFFTGTDLVNIMHWLGYTYQIRDFYQSTKAEVEERMWAWNRPRDGIVYGGFLPKPHLSAAIGYIGPVTFDILPGQPQIHVKGGFVTFPTLSAQEVRNAGKEGIFALCASRNVTPRAVEEGVLRAQNSLPTGISIPAPNFRPKLRGKKLALKA